MGIQLDEFDKRIIEYVANQKRLGNSVYLYLYGVLASSVDLFVAGHSEKRDLESMWATVKLVDRLCKTHSPDELDEISCGTREVPVEDVPSGH